MSQQAARLVRASALLAAGLLVQVWVDRTMTPPHIDRGETVREAMDARPTQGLQPISLRQEGAGEHGQQLRPIATAGTVDNRPDMAPGGPTVSVTRRAAAGSARPARVPDARGPRREPQAMPAPMILVVADAGIAPPRRTLSSTTRRPRLTFAAEPLALPDATKSAASRGGEGAGRRRHPDMISIRRVIQEYATAFGRLDPGAAKRVWPSLDEEALARAFRGLRAQSLTFDDCGVTLVGEVAAQANCHGRATYLPKVGRRRPLSTTGEWTFSLERTGSAWVIQSAAVQ